MALLEGKEPCHAIKKEQEVEKNYLKFCERLAFLRSKYISGTSGEGRAMSHTEKKKKKKK